MKFINRYFGIIWGIASFLAVLFWMILLKRFDWEQWIGYSSCVCALYVFYSSRSFRGNKFRYITMASTLSLIGLGLRVMRWAFAFEIQVVSTGMMMVAYLLFFIRFTRQNWLDWIKVATGMLAGILFLFRLFHLPLPLPDIQLAVILIWPVYLGITYCEARGMDISIIEKPEKPELPNDIL